MTILKDIQELAVTKKTPVIKPGFTVRIHQRIKEGEKERTQIFEGLVIKVNSGHGADKTFTVRKVVDGIGVEKIFPLYSSNIQKIEVKKQSKVRRAKLYYMRDRFGKSARLKGSFVSDAEMEEAINKLADEKAEEATEEPKAEEPKAEEPKAEEPKAEEPKAEEPKAEEPKAEEPKAEEPKAEEPKAEEK